MLPDQTSTIRPRRRLLDQLRARGIRLTSQRAVLMNILENEEGFLDVATLCRLARRKGARVDRATVYRTLAMLRANDLLAFDGGAGASPSAVPQSHGDAPESDEFGMVCEQCGTRQPVANGAPDSIKKELLRCTGFDVRSMRLQARGACRLCAARLRIRSKGKPIH